METQHIETSILISISCIHNLITLDHIRLKKKQIKPQIFYSIFLVSQTHETRKFTASIRGHVEVLLSLHVCLNYASSLRVLTCKIAILTTPHHRASA